MCWQAIAAGSNGLVFYAIWLALEPANLVNPPTTAATEWAHLVGVGDEISAFAPVLMQPPMLPAPIVLHLHPAWLMLRSHWAERKTGCFIFAVNDGTGSGTVTLSGFGGQSLKRVTLANVHPPRLLPLPPVAATAISFAMAQMDVIVLQILFN